MKPQRQSPLEEASEKNGKRVSRIRATLWKL
jgi:hypothetical protein